MLADLHIHTYFSDGTQSPEEVAENAIKRRLSLISVCDHDTVAAYTELYPACAGKGLLLISGVEICTSYKDFTLHILAYGFKQNNEEFLSLLQKNRNIMDKISDELIKKMEKDYQQISFKEFLSFERNPKNGGWKGIDYLKYKGLEGDYPQCMKYYKQYECGYNGFPQLEFIVTAIHSAGGYAVIAHPGDTLDNTPEIFSLELKNLLNYGIDGVECYYPTHTNIIVNTCLDFCKKNNLLITVGSDNHGNFANKLYLKKDAWAKDKIEIEKLNLKRLF